MDSWPPKWLTPIPETQLARGRVEEPVVDFVEAFGRITKDSVAVSYTHLTLPTKRIV